MARVTVEDCVLKIPNRFELVMLASQRAREISSGAAITVERDNDKNPVIALREIADTDISIENLKEVLIKNYQKVIEIEEDDEEIIDIMEGEEDWEAVSSEAAETDVVNAGMHEEVLTPPDNLPIEAVDVKAEDLLPDSLISDSNTDTGTDSDSVSEEVIDTATSTDTNDSNQ